MVDLGSGKYQVLTAMSASDLQTQLNDLPPGLNVACLTVDSGGNFTAILKEVSAI